MPRLVVSSPGPYQDSIGGSAIEIWPGCKPPQTWNPEFQKWRVYASRAGRKILTMQIAEKSSDRPR